MNTTTASPLTVNTKDEVFFKEMGLRIAQARKERNITQVQLCAKLGIAQQTLAHYEGGRLRLPSSLLAPLAHELQVSVESLLGQVPAPKAKAASKRGPPSQLQQQVNLIAKLPRAKQRFVMEMLDTVLAQASSR
jgi:transcriptional regulator with XRE-family HTH domain